MVIIKGKLTASKYNYSSEDGRNSANTSQPQTSTIPSNTFEYTIPSTNVFITKGIKLVPVNGSLDK